MMTWQGDEKKDELYLHAHAYGKRNEELKPNCTNA